eukprot:g1179.t1
MNGNKVERVPPAKYTGKVVPPQKRKRISDKAVAKASPKRLAKYLEKRNIAILPAFVRTKSQMVEACTSRRFCAILLVKSLDVSSPPLTKSIKGKLRRLARSVRNVRVVVADLHQVRFDWPDWLGRDDDDDSASARGVLPDPVVDQDGRKMWMLFTSKLTTRHGRDVSTKRARSNDEDPEPFTYACAAYPGKDLNVETMRDFVERAVGDLFDRDRLDSSDQLVRFGSAPPSLKKRRRKSSDATTTATTTTTTKKKKKKRKAQTPKTPDSSSSSSSKTTAERTKSSTRRRRRKRKTETKATPAATPTREQQKRERREAERRRQQEMWAEEIENVPQAAESTLDEDEWEELLDDGSRRETETCDSADDESVEGDFEDIIEL